MPAKGRLWWSVEGVVILFIGYCLSKSQLTLDVWRKPDYPEGPHTDYANSNQKPVTFLLWDNPANHSGPVPPLNTQDDLNLQPWKIHNYVYNSCLQQWCILFLCLHGCVYNSQRGQFKKPNMINLLAVSRLFYLFTGKNSHKSIIQDHLITGLDLYLARWKCVEHAYFKSHPLQQCFAQGYISSCINGKIVTHWVVLGVSHIHASWWFVLHLWIIQHLMISDDTLGFFERPELKIKLSRVWKLRLDCNEHIEAMTLCRISSRHSPGWHLSWHRLV